MNNCAKSIKNWSLALVVVLSFTACGQPTSSPTAPSLPLENMALEKPVTASTSVSGQPPINAVDGDPNTAWRSGTSPDQWIQIDLGGFAALSEFKLVVYQSEAGQTIHRILAGSSPDNLEFVHEFSEITTDRQELVFIPTIPVSDIRYVRIVTTLSPGWVAWREIQLFGIFESIVFEPTSVPEADIIYYNGQILTMEPGQPTVDAIAVRGEKILALGNQADIFAYQGDTTRMVNLQGLTMTPGFIDSHQHRIGDRWHYGNPPVEQLFYEILSEGWTSVHELWVDNARLNELVTLDSQDQIPVRVSMYLKMNSEYTIDNWWQTYQPLQQYSPYLQIGGLKITLDREWGEQVFLNQDQLNLMVRDAHTRGWQVAIHSFSPTANELILNAYANALGNAPNEPQRFRIEHLGVILDEQIQQMASLGIIGSIQLVSTGGYVDDASFIKNIPASQESMTAPWRDLMDAGVYLIGNTDAPWCCTDWRHNFQGPSYFPTVPQAIYQGMTRTTFWGRPPEAWQTTQILILREALELMTIRSAYAGHQENVIGSLKVGKYADLVILSGDLLTTPVLQMPNVQVVMTMVGGKVKYCQEGYQGICTATSSP